MIQWHHKFECWFLSLTLMMSLWVNIHMTNKFSLRCIPNGQISCFVTMKVYIIASTILSYWGIFHNFTSLYKLVTLLSSAQDNKSNHLQQEYDRERNVTNTCWFVSHSTDDDDLLPGWLHPRLVIITNTIQTWRFVLKQKTHKKLYHYNKTQYFGCFLRETSSRKKIETIQ